jgi:dephospho-CoA kinase
MPIFALTGKLCTGKTSVLKMLKAKGARIFSADKKVQSYYHNKKSSIYKKIAQNFKNAVVRGKIDRKRLGSLVFCDKNKLRKLEDIIHPVIIRDLKKWIRGNRHKAEIYVAEVPLLFEKKLQRYFDGLILVYVKKDVLLKRIKKDLNLPKSKALKRLRLFIPDNIKAKNADFIIDNSSNIKHLKEEVALLWNKLINRKSLKID